MKISTGWKLVLYALTITLLVQGYDLAFYLMNRKDDLLANLGIVTLVLMNGGTIYSLYQITVLSSKVIKEQIEKEKKL